MTDQTPENPNDGQPESDLPPGVGEERAERTAPRRVIADDLGSEMDPAHRALADALRLSFRVIQGVMILLIIGFLLTGFRMVREQEQGVRLLFGDIQDDAPLGPGPHLAWPAPVGEFIRLMTAPRRLEMNEAFWLHLDSDERSLPFADLNRDMRSGLVPGEDGSVITADQNIAHTRWSVEYRISDPALLIRNVKGSEHLHQGGSEAELLVRNAVERGVVLASAQTELDSMIASPSTLNSLVQGYAQSMLDRLGTGIQIEAVQCKQARPPRAILADYEAVNTASSEANRALEQARDEATTTLNAIAGQAHRKLALMIRIYEALTEGIDPAEEDIERLCTMVDDPEAIRLAANDAQDFLSEIDQVLTSPEVGGEVASIVADARQYSTRLVSKLASETEQLSAYHEAYLDNPNLIRMDLWLSAMRKVYDGRIERFMLSPSTNLIEIQLNRQAWLLRQKQRQANRREQEEAINMNNPEMGGDF